jgi:hypothetical protein
LNQLVAFGRRNPWMQKGRGNRCEVLVLAAGLSLLTACAPTTAEGFQRPAAQSTATTFAPSTASSQSPASCAVEHYVHKPSISILKSQARIAPDPDNGQGLLIRNDGDRALRRLTSQGQVFVLDANDNQIGAQRTTFSEVELVVRPGGARTIQFADTIDLDRGCSQDFTGIPSENLAAVIRIWLGTDAFEAGHLPSISTVRPHASRVDPVPPTPVSRQPSSRRGVDCAVVLLARRARLRRHS